MKDNSPNNGHNNDWQAAGKALRQLLAADVDLSPTVMELIFNEAVYQRRLELLIAEKKSIQPLIDDVQQHLDHGPNMTTIAKNGVNAFWGWMKAGFGVVAPAQFQARLAACEKCPFYRATTKGVIYQLAAKVTGDSPVCGHCGCTILKKAKLVSSACPVEHPEQPGLTRWNEPVRR